MGYSFTEAEVSNMLVNQKDYILQLANDGKIAEARACLGAIKELWVALEYQYKLLEVQKRIDDRQKVKEQYKATVTVRDHYKATIKDKLEALAKIDLLQNLISVKSKSDGRMTTTFEAYFKEHPSDMLITLTQRKEGYAPEGYGGPSGVKIERDELNARWRATWSCMGCCD